MNEMVMTEVTKSPQEKLNLEMFKQTAREQGKDVSKVRGTGLMRQYVPEFMQEDVCERPERNSRPDSWEDSSYSYEDPSSFN
jgi:glycine cleavage system pyridoxal-binding protein P